MNKELTILEDIASLDNSTLKNTEYTHSIHPYPAKFIPNIPSKIIEAFSNERHTILDPFSGSGTTILEAKIRGRNAIGFDINPIGILTARVKTHCYSDKQIIEIDNVLETIIPNQYNNDEKQDLWVPDIPRIHHWFKHEVIDALKEIVDKIRRIEDIDVQRFFNLCLSGIIVSVSNQESETRFAAKDNTITYDEVFSIFKKKAILNRKKIKSLNAIEKFKKSNSVLYLNDTRSISKILSENSIDLVITSPPYVNSFDYYLYHKFRIFWLSYPENREIVPVSEVQKNEIGSRYKYSGPNGADINDFKSEMIDCFRNIHLVTKPGKMIFIIVGDSIIKGNFHKMDEFYKEIANESGMKFIASTSYNMKNASKSFISQNTTNKFFTQKNTHVLVFKNGSKNIINNNNISEKPPIENIEDSKSYQEVIEIPDSVENGSSLIIKSEKVTDFTHGLIKYPAKYIPHIPRWAIKKYSKVNDLVLDNFMGSGTTNLEAALLDRKSIGTDVNPLAIMTSKVKTTPLNPIDLEKAFSDIISQLKDLSISDNDIIDFPLKDFWFPNGELLEFFRLKKSVFRIKDQNIRDFFSIVLYSILKKISYLDESQLKVKRDHQKLVNGVPSPIELFKNQAVKSINSMRSYFEYLNENNIVPHTVCLESSSTTKLPKLKGKVDLVVSSPPYINAMNYPMFHRYELLLSGLIDPTQYVEHQTEYLGTERVYSQQYNTLQYFSMKNNNFEDLNKKISRIFEKEKKRAFIVSDYFHGMKISIENVYNYLKPGGVYVIVCGSNEIKNEPIDTCSILGDIAIEIGFKKELEFTYKILKHRFKITRHKTGKKIQEDKIIVLRK